MYQGFIHSYIRSAESREIQHASITFKHEALQIAIVPSYNLRLGPPTKEGGKQKPTKKIKSLPEHIKTYQNPSTTNPNQANCWLVTSLCPWNLNVDSTKSPRGPAVRCVDATPGWRHAELQNILGFWFGLYGIVYLLMIFWNKLSKSK